MAKTLIIFALLHLISIEPDALERKSLRDDNSRLNTAVNSNWLSSLEKEVIYEINRLRSNPGKYADDYLIVLRKHYKQKYLNYPGDLPLLTHEGVNALNECIRELQLQKPLPLVYPAKGLSLAAKDHVKDQGRTGKTGHIGEDRSDLKTRIERYGQWNVRIAENIAYGGISARQIVIYLLIDDGIKNRGHRLNFLNPDLRFIGVAEGKHPVYNRMIVMDFAGAFTEN